MRRADRLFQIVHILRSRKLTTAAYLANQLDVVERTIYRDIQDLILSGVQIEGEAGVGYVLKKGFELPPLMFHPEELQALLVGIRMVKSWSDSDLSLAATHALNKIQAVLPDSIKNKMSSSLHVPDFHSYPVKTLKPIRDAIDNTTKMHIKYSDETQKTSSRTIWPLGLFYWGNVWTLLGWCELRDDFRSFRIDRIQDLKGLQTKYQKVPGKTLKDYLAIVQCDDVE